MINLDPNRTSHTNQYMPIPRGLEEPSATPLMIQESMRYQTLKHLQNVHSWISVVLRSIPEKKATIEMQCNDAYVEFTETLDFFKSSLAPFYSNALLSHLSKNQIPSYIKIEEIKVINLFFKELFETPDFQNETTKTNKLFILSKVLKKSFDNQDYCKSIFIPLCFEALESCEDRVAITFNRMILELKIRELTLKKDPMNLAKLLIGYARLQLLHEEVSTLCKERNLGDHIEVMLYLETRLAKALSMPIFISEMTYPGVGEIPKNEIERIREKIFYATRSPTQMIQVLTESLRPIYGKNGKVLSYGRLSATNPYLHDVSEIWKQHLKTLFPRRFEAIPLNDEDLMDPRALHTYQINEHKLLRSLSKDVFSRGGLME